MSTRERALLSALLGSQTDSADLFAPEDFAHPAARAAVAAIFELRKRGDSVSPLTICAELERTGHHGNIQGLGGKAGLEAMAAEQVSRSDFAAMARGQNVDARRKLTQQALGAAQQALGEGGDPSAVLSEWLPRVEEAATTRAPDQGVSAQQAAQESFAAFCKRQRCQVPPGVRADLPEVTELLDGGFQPGRVYIVGARPSVGKSCAAFGFADAAAIKQRVPVRAWPLEMTPRQCVDRLVCRRVSASVTIPAARWRKPGMANRADAQAFMQSMSEIAESPLTFGTSTTGPGILAELTRWARSPQVEEQLGKAMQAASYVVDGETILAELCPIAIIDHLHLVTRDKEKLGEFTNAAKNLAGRLQIAIIIVAQLNRSSSSEERPPRISDLRGSGAIEENADVVMLYHRDVSGEDKVTASMEVAKNRDGETGRVDLSFNGPRYSFERRREPEWTESD